MASNLKVLLVDDNPMILGMLEHALKSMGQLTTAADGPDALLKAIDDNPDLVIADYQLQGMDGRQLIEKLKGRPTTARIPIILLASKNDINEKLKPIQDAVEDFIEKPFFLKDAVARIKRVLDKIALEKMAREASEDGSLRGSLEQMNVIDLIQSLEMGRKTCLLTLTRAGDRCALYVSEGQITHASYGSLIGDEAVYKALTWQEGSFHIDFKGRSSEQTTNRSTQGLLMEGLRLLDESNRDVDEDNVLET
jgi:CheY-like chemotaxis protein